MKPVEEGMVLGRLTLLERKVSSIEDRLLQLEVRINARLKEEAETRELYTSADADTDSGRRDRGN